MLLRAQIWSQIRSPIPSLAWRLCRYSTTSNKPSTSRMPKSAKKGPSNFLRRSIPGQSEASKIAYSQRLKDHDNTYKGIPLQPVVAVTNCESYDLKKAVEALARQGFQAEKLIPKEAVQFEYEGKEVFVLSTGSIVSWGLSESTTISEALPLVKEAMIGPYNVESEDLDFVEFADTPEHSTSFMDGEIICICGNLSESLLDKAAFSFGIARSTRLAVLETALEKHLLMTRQYTEDLSTGKRLSVTAKDVLKSSGRLMLLRGKLNLYSELIETPDLYWSEPKLEKIYSDVSRILDISARISILNRKLDYAIDESTALTGILNEANGARLEWIIIYLITFEVIIEIYRWFLEKKEATEAT
ncbi:unnamed protein product [Kuraishia capsulata CBS 1993]|uniref:DUF155 domain-containing protein n=1 Tax=Kuraishia capsulata CBS 1993 TaxID=1382522 RepID=W6MRI7_9ASCO|nr:uncharacterized protein KUCA_T00005312001 [Kuraishia capsulata CBS 1993]CDK29324.1 unnamed protein product [Kuraishia capsulata CBS 1993]